MSNIYEKRWNKAKSLASAINKRKDEAIKKFGKKVIFLWRDQIITGDLIIEDDTIYIRDGGCIFGIFDNNRDLDHGLFSTMEEIKKMFDEFEIYVPFN